MINRDKLNPWRTYTIGLIFCLLCVLLAAKLLSVTVLSNDRYSPDNGVLTYEETVPAVRGRILDRNGVEIVGNECTYSLVMRAQALPDSVAEINAQCLTLLHTVSRTDADLLFPLLMQADGTVVYHPEVSDPDSDRRLHWRRCTSYLETGTDISAPELYEKLLERYALDTWEKDGLFTFDEVWQILELRYDMLYKQFSTLNDYVYKANLTTQEITAALELGLPSLSAQAAWTRVYRYPGYASHLLGTVGKMRASEQQTYLDLGYAATDLVGHDGVEEAFETALHGIDGINRVYTDADGNVLRTEVVREAVPGMDITLTIDIGLQVKTEDELADNIRFLNNNVLGANPEYPENNLCHAGAAVVMDPDTFEVLAAASYPTYDLTTYSVSYSDLLANPYSVLTNRALYGLYAPGSTFKLGVAAAALTAGTITRDTIIHTEGRYYWKAGSSSQNCAIWDSQHTTHGDINVIQAIGVSCNWFFFEVGRRLGIESMMDYAENLGLGVATGIELPEKIGQTDRPANNKNWIDSEVLNASIGQGTNTFTPLQICTYLCSLWNGGVRYNTHVVLSVDDTVTGEKTQTVVTEQSRVTLSAQDLQTVKDGMAQVIVENADTVGLFLQGLSDDVSVYGKTGTAERGGNLPANALFACVGERGDDRLAIITVLENGQHGYYAARTCSRILRYWFND